MPDQDVSQNGESSNWKSHIIGLLYPSLLSFIILDWEYKKENFFYFYYRPYQPLLEKMHSLLVVPVGLGGAILTFAVLTFFLNKKYGFKAHSKQAVLSGIVLGFYLLLITLENDTKAGSFLNPAWVPGLKFKTVYVRSFLSLLLVSIYAFGFFAILNRPQAFGVFSNCFIYFYAIPFFFWISPIYHSFLLVLAFLVFLLGIQLGSKINPGLQISEKKFSFCFVVLLFLVACGFRLWLWNFNVENDYLKTITDSQDYFENSQRLWEGKPLLVRAVPAYSYLLYLIYHITGFGLSKAVAFLSVLSCFVPVLIFFITRKITNLPIAILAGLAAAFSEHLISYAAINHRNGPAALFLTAALFFLLHINSQKPLRFAFAFGFCFGWAAMLDGASAPLIVLAFLPYFRKEVAPFFKKIFLAAALGVVVAQTPFQLVIYDRWETIYPLGRQYSSLDAQWNYAKIKEGFELKEIGFDPPHDFLHSLKVLMEKPLTVIPLLSVKIFKEFQNYFLDRQVLVFDFGLMDRESYFGASVRFYYFLAFAIGSVGFIFSKRINWMEKALIAGPVFYSLIFHSIMSMGTNRYRIVTQPLILVLFAYGCYLTGRWLTKQAGPLAPTAADSFREKATRFFENFPTRDLRLNAVGSLIVMIIVGFALLLQNFKTIYPFPGVDKKYGVSWGISFNEENFQNNILLPKPVRISKTIPEDGKYSIALRFATTFGPNQVKSEFLFLGRGMIGKKEIPSRRQWIYFDDVQLKKGKQTFVLMSSFKVQTGKKEKKKGGYFGGLGKRINDVEPFKLTGFELIPTTT